MEEPRRNLCRWCPAILVALVVASSLAATAVSARAGGGAWQSGPSVPLARSEVASASWRGKIVIVGGYLASGRSSGRVDVYDPRRRRWSRLPGLPVGVNHAMAAADGARLYVAGGYADGDDGGSETLRSAYVLEGGRWRSLPAMPEPRAAGGAAVVGGKLYVVGGTFAPGRLAREAFVYDPAARAWRAVPGPTPREHLGVAALNGSIFAVGGRTAGFDTNLGLVEALRPGRAWRQLPSLPDTRGGTGLAATRGRLVSVGGEEPAGAIREVYALAPGEPAWRRLDDLPTPRHGLAVEAVGGRVYAIAGGPRPGLTVSGANESLALP